MQAARDTARPFPKLSKCIQRPLHLLVRNLKSLIGRCQFREAALRPEGAGPDLACPGRKESSPRYHHRRTQEHVSLELYDITRA